MDNNYVLKSLELHLFFGRIMKEHSLFLEAGFTPVNSAFAKMAEFYRENFAELLDRAVWMSDGIISPAVMSSGEFVTEFTLAAEMQTQQFTGIDTSQSITEKELAMTGTGSDEAGRMPEAAHVHKLNLLAWQLLDGLVMFKQNILANVENCRMFTMNYPLLIEHIIREAKLYRTYVEQLEREGDIDGESMRDVECFWNQIMMEHALFIRGLLDPAEEELIHTAGDFAQEYKALLESCRSVQEEMQAQTPAALTETLKFRDFKKAGTQGIEECKIRSIILPLLADHVLREANHYIRPLEQ